MLAMLRGSCVGWWRPFALACLTMSVAVTGGCCQTGSFDLKVGVPPEDRSKSCFELCGKVDLAPDVDGLALCETSEDRATVTCTFTYTDCPQELL